MNTRARPISAVLVCITLGCVSATADPGDPFVGSYDATEHVVITFRNNTSVTMDDVRPVTIVHGSNADLVLSDGLCIFAADATGASTMMLHPNSGCVRDMGNMSHVTLHLQTGSGTLMGRSVNVMVHGTFEFVLGADAGMLPDDQRTGSFDLTITGTRQ